MANDTLIDRLIEKGLMSTEDGTRLKKEAGSDEASLDQLLAAQGIPDQAVLKAKGEVYGIPTYHLGDRHVGVKLLRYIPEESVRHYRFVPLEMEDGVLKIGMLDPSNIEAREALKFLTSKTNLPFKIYAVSQNDFDAILEEYKSLGGEVTRALYEFESALSGEELELAAGAKKPETILVEEAPVTKMVAVIIRHATEGRASDIHIEPGEEKLRIRFRMDGVLYTSLLLPMTVHESLVSRLKILTKMKLDEKRKPQDGRFSAKIDERRIDFRVSTFPTHFGEKVVIRILDPERTVINLKNLGFEGRNLKEVERILKLPYGLVLVTGPTGSGKTTTLYAMLQALDRERFNIVSLEDPIEYNVDGVSQSQVRPEIGYSFATGLRSILRQDPDIMLVGEIRDKETAGLAIHAALTGHLVLSTLHTNNAVGAITRLMDMGVEPYLIAPALAAVVAQRLVQTLCEDSRKSLMFTGSLKEKLVEELVDIPEEARKFIKWPKEIFEALPSAICPKGTRGRIGIIEVLTKTKELEEIILTDPARVSLSREGRRQGMIMLREDGILKVLNGKVGLEQLSQII